MSIFQELGLNPVKRKHIRIDNRPHFVMNNLHFKPTHHPAYHKGPEKINLKDQPYLLTCTCDGIHPRRVDQASLIELTTSQIDELVNILTWFVIKQGSLALLTRDEC